MSSVARQEVEIKINAHHCYLLQRYFLIQILLSFYVYFFLFAAVNCNFFYKPIICELQKEMAMAPIHEGRSSADECNAAFKKN